MKTLILTAFLTLTMNAFATTGQTHDVDCAALAESTERVGKDVSKIVKSKESKSVKARKK